MVLKGHQSLFSWEHYWEEFVNACTRALIYIMLLLKKENHRWFIGLFCFCRVMICLAKKKNSCHKPIDNLHAKQWFWNIQMTDFILEFKCTNVARCARLESNYNTKSNSKSKSKSKVSWAIQFWRVPWILGSNFTPGFFNFSIFKILRFFRISYLVFRISYFSFSVFQTWNFPVFNFQDFSLWVVSLSRYIGFRGKVCFVQRGLCLVLYWTLGQSLSR